MPLPAENEINLRRHHQGDTSVRRSISPPRRRRTVAMAAPDWAPTVDSVAALLRTYARGGDRVRGARRGAGAEFTDATRPTHGQVQEVHRARVRRRLRRDRRPGAVQRRAARLDPDPRRCTAPASSCASPTSRRRREARATSSTRSGDCSISARSVRRSSPAARWTPTTRPTTAGRSRRPVVAAIPTTRDGVRHPVVS